MGFGPDEARTAPWSISGYVSNRESARTVLDKSARTDGTFSRGEFVYDSKTDAYTCPAGKLLKRRQRRHDNRPDIVPADGSFRYRASKADCDACALKPRCCPTVEARKVPRSIREDARNIARGLTKKDEWLISRRERKKVEMLFAHLKRILRLDRLRLRGPCGARDEFHLAAAQNLRKLAKIIPMPIQTAPA
jgi:Transposase DDE domain